MVNRVDLSESNFEPELKEALCESILGGLKNAVSGGGKDGKEIVDSSPSLKFVSGFLQPVGIPRKFTSGGDETTNPIHVISVGADFQVTKSPDSTIQVKPHFSIYVRALPTVEQLTEKKVKLTLSDEARKKLNIQIKDSVSAFDAEHEDLKEQNKDEFYKQRQEIRKATAEAYLKKKLGLIVDAEDINKQHMLDEDDIQAGLSTPEGESVEESIEPDEESSSFSLEYFVYPGMKSIIPDDVVKRVRPIPRWLRIDIDNIKPFSISTLSSPDELYSLIQEQNIAVKEAIQEKLSQWFNSNDSETCGSLWAYPTNLACTPKDIQNWNETLERLRNQIHTKNDLSSFSLPNLNLEWTIELAASKTDSNILTAKVMLENMTDNDRSRQLEAEFEESVYLAELRIGIVSNAHVPIKLDRVKPSYRYNRYLTYPALGINCGVVAEHIGENLEIRTTPMPIYRQPRIVPIVKGDTDLTFTSLATESGVKSLVTIPNQFSEWIENTKNNIDPTEGIQNKDHEIREKEKFQHDLQKWAKEAEKIQQGIDVLLDSHSAYSENPNSAKASAYKAWQYMNESMEGAASGKYSGWRLFQLCFILSQLGGIVSREQEFYDYYDREWDESVVLLYFATGGGKTESFFGLLVFNLFFDRLREKLHGVTALIRYPLRLLTIQQAQRLSRTLAHSERIRWKYNIQGDSFTIGFWVGGGNTPNRRSQISINQIPEYEIALKKSEDELNLNPEYVTASEDWNKLPRCPFCGCGTVLRKFNKLGGIIGHLCTSSDQSCDWTNKFEAGKVAPLPFLIVDEDIYEKAPSVILGTIDKLALIGQRPSTIRKFIGMLGLAPLIDSTTNTLKSYDTPSSLESSPFTRLHPFYENGKDHFYDPFPSMIIQDEAHLLEESLGTFSGIFQTAFEEFLRRIGNQERLFPLLSKVPDTNTPRLPKIIAASATVSNPDRQMEDLYQRDVVQFPIPGPTLYSSFYAEPQLSSFPERESIAATDVELAARTARFYSTLLTNGRPHTSTSVEVLGNFHLKISQYSTWSASSDADIRNSLREELKENLNSSPWSSHFRKLIDEASDEQIATVIDLHRIALTYVTNKKGGDQIMSAELDTTARIHEESGLDWFEGFSARLISGALTASEIESVIEEAEERPNIGTPLQDIKSESILRSVVATSAISHGVDVDEFNTMFFAGMPSDTAEYIQSSSRIGRTHVGCSILLPTPQRRRDRYILETHDQYHRFLERMIRPPAVNRWAENAILRTLPSLIQLYLIAVIELSELFEADDNDKSSVLNYERLDSISRLKNKSGEMQFKKDITNFICSAVGLYHSKFAPTALDGFEGIIRDDIYDTYLADISKMQAEGISGLKEYFDELNKKNKRIKRTPMTSLRDVDPAGHLKYQKGISADPSSEDVYELMRLIRSGTGA
jgi:superfamily II DNA/RNA helicase